MKPVATVARILLGLTFTVFGLDFFFHYMPEQPVSEEGMAFLMGLFNSGYLFEMIKGIEIVSGMMLIAGIMVPLALVLLAPIVVNIALYHLVLDPNGIFIAVGLTILEIFLLWRYRDAYRGFFTWRVEPLLGGPTPERTAAGSEGLLSGKAAR